MTLAHSNEGSFRAAGSAEWLSALRRYTAFVAVANLVWELAHMPLFFGKKDQALGREVRRGMIEPGIWSCR